MARVRFVDRVEELEALRGWCSVSRYCPLYIYGPEGCGKTRLVREFASRVSELLGGDALAIYIDALEATDIGKAISLSPSIGIDLAKLALEALPSSLASFGSLGAALASSIPSIVKVVAEKLTKSFLKGRNVVIVVDDVSRAIGLSKVEWYVKWLSELMERLAEEYELRVMNIVVTTSEGTSLDLVSRHRHAEVRLLWNMDKRSFEELFKELNPPQNVDFETVWKLLGGNPGKLMELATRFQWNLDEMIESYTYRITKVIENIKTPNSISKLLELAKDISKAEEEIDEEMKKLIDYLIDRNLLIYKKWLLLTHKPFTNQDPELGIGEKYAWQVPLYRELVMKALSKHL